MAGRRCSNSGRSTLPPPAPGEVPIRHTAIGVNFIDVYCRTGYFDLLTPPGVPGMEAAGVVEAVGPRRRAFQPGDRVAYACPPVGAYAERRNMAPRSARPAARTTFPTRRPPPAC